MLNVPQFVAVDVSKAMLDLATHDAAWRTANSVSGIAALSKRLARYERPHVVCEATGRYGRLLARQMGIANYRGFAQLMVDGHKRRSFSFATLPPATKP